MQMNEEEMYSSKAADKFGAGADMQADNAILTTGHGSPADVMSDMPPGPTFRPHILWVESGSKGFDSSVW